MDNQGDIGALSNHCARSFNELLKSLSICPKEIHTHMSPGTIDNDFARFKIWCGNLGALQRGRSSLDVRLRDSTVMRETVLRFLGQLNDSLKQSIEVTTGSRPPWEKLKRPPEDTPAGMGRLDEPGELNIEANGDKESDTSDTSDEDNGELAERQSEIQDTIAHLYRLSFKMRNASHRSLSIKALSMRIVDEETGEDLFSGYATFDYQHVSESLQQLRHVPQPLTPDLQPVRRVDNNVSTFLLERLSRAITNRRRYFAYWQRHALKLSRVVDEPVVPQKNPATSQETKPEEPQVGLADQHKAILPNQTNLLPISGPKTMISGTDISKYQNNLDDYLDIQTVISYATTAKDIDGSSVALPLPPADASSKPEFVCPYCWVACPSRQGKGKSWRTHILQDLQPYVCTFRDCSDGDCLYASRGAWMEHERICHRRIWRCFDQQHGNILYNTKEQLHLHFSKYHTDLTELQIHSFLELAETTMADDREICPFCNSAGPFDNGLYNHMAFHQERLATFAAPRNVDENDDESRSGKAEGIRSAESLRSMSLYFSDTPGADINSQGGKFRYSIGICALDSKARSRSARNIFGKLVDEFEVKIFGDKIILDEDVENWPVCDFLVSFFSDGFPLDKAIAYARLRKPFCVNDLPMQQVLWDRRLCLQILDKLNVPTPKRVEVSRDGGPRLQSADFARSFLERTGVSLPGPPDGTGGGLPAPKKVELIDGGNTISVDGVTLTKPFVEKPVSGEDHNIYIYYHQKDGKGGRRLFRKVNNKSSEKDDKLDIPRSIIDPSSSYIYEQFLQVENSEDVKVYTVGPSYCHAETRKSPVVDGIVKRNPNGKEVRYVTKLSDAEAAMASRISEGFGQRVCGFDLLRCGDRSYVNNVNGWSFAKNNNDYYEKATQILKEMFLKEIQRNEDGEIAVDDDARRIR